MIPYSKTSNLFLGFAVIAMQFLFAACTSEDLPGYPDEGGRTNTPFSIQIEPATFNSQHGTRANNTSQPYTTTFGYGDQAGLIAVDKDNIVVSECNNIPLTYNGSTWNFPENFQEYYTPDYTYIVYFPYSEKASGMTSIDAIRQSFPPASDQSSISQYTLAEVMAATGTWDSDSKTLQFNMKYVHTLLTLPTEYNTRFTFADKDWSFPNTIQQASVTVDGKIYKTCKWTYSGQNQYRVIVPSTGQECELTARLIANTPAGDKGYTLSTRKELSMNRVHEWSIKSLDIGDYTAAGVIRVGDYLCRATDGDGWSIVPQEAPEEAKNCLGIVFHVGHNGLDKSDYSLSGIKENECHGYAVALTDVNKDGNDRLRWGYKDGQYSMNAGTSPDENDWNGYINQKAIENFASTNTDGWLMENFEAAYRCRLYGTEQSYDWQKQYTAPENTSGWFLPSCGQLRSIYSVNRDNADLLKKQIEKVKFLDVDNIRWFSTSWYYWSSSEYPDYSFCARGVDFYYGSVYNDSKSNTYDVRAVLAF